MVAQLVAIQSVPRSGSSWLGQIFKSSPQVAFRYQPLFSYLYKGRLGPHSSREECLRFFTDIRHTTDHYVLQQDPNFHVDYPELIEREDVSHVVMKEVRYNHILPNLIEQVHELKIVGLVRHPCAVIDSWSRAPREFKAEWNLEEQWRSGDLKNQGRPEECFGFDKWKEVATLFLDLERKYPERVKVVRYDDLNTDPVRYVEELFSFCGLEMAPEVISFIQESRKKDGTDANSIYRRVRVDDGWLARLPSVISNTILSELQGSELERFL